ncbi:unnamed protein product [Closterium sp. Yama58-4]|nr:unnamed protein product [Closterium sp. Yama58-4]
MASSRPLDRIGLPQPLINRFFARGLTTAQQVLSLTAVDLMEVLDCDGATVRDAMIAVSRAACPPSCTVADIAAAGGTGHLRLDLPALDAALAGGLPCGAITEIAGPAGAGKTQMCMQAARRFSPKRVAEIAVNRFPAFFSSHLAMEQLLSRILLVQPVSSAELLDRIANLHTSLAGNSTRLIIIDSIAALVRIEFGADNLIQRQQLLSHQASKLKYLAESFCLPVLVTNHVAAASSSSSSHSAGLPAPNELDGRRAALGAKWSHCVNVSLLLSTVTHAAGSHRVLHIVKAPMAPQISFPFTITNSGLQLFSTRTAAAMAEESEPPKKMLLDDDHEDEVAVAKGYVGEEFELRVNEEYAKRLEYNKRREEMHRLEEKVKAGYLPSGERSAGFRGRGRGAGGRFGGRGRGDGGRGGGRWGGRGRGFGGPWGQDRRFGRNDEAQREGEGEGEAEAEAEAEAEEGEAEDSEEEEDERDEHLLRLDQDVKFVEALTRIKNKDPEIFKPGKHLFESEDEEEDEEEEEGEGEGEDAEEEAEKEEDEEEKKQKKKKKAKAVYLKDVLAQQAIDGVGLSDDEDGRGAGGADSGGERASRKGYFAEQEELKKAFLDGAEAGGWSGG